MGPFFRIIDERQSGFFMFEKGKAQTREMQPLP